MVVLIFLFHLKKHRILGNTKQGKKKTIRSFMHKQLARPVPLSQYTMKGSILEDWSLPNRITYISGTGYFSVCSQMFDIVD